MKKQSVKQIVSIALVCCLLLSMASSSNFGVTAAASAPSSLEQVVAAYCRQCTQPLVTTAATFPKLNMSNADAREHLESGTTIPGIVYSSTFRDGTDALWNINPSTYYSAVKNPASVLYTENKWGHVYNEAAYYGTVCSTTALKCCGYRYPYDTTEIPLVMTEKTDHSIHNLEVGDLLWTAGHVAGVVGVNRDGASRVTGVEIVEQGAYVQVFEVTASQWDSYFARHWTTIYRGDIDDDQPLPTEYPENDTIIFSRGNNTYVSDCSSMLFYIPTATTVFLTKDGHTTAYDKTSFDTQTVNGTTVYELGELFTGVGDYYLHTDEDETDIGITVINKGSVTISGGQALLDGYENCQPICYRVIEIVNSTSVHNFWNAPAGYSSMHVYNSFADIRYDAFVIDNIPTSWRYKIEVFYDTGYGWDRLISDDVFYDFHAYTNTCDATCNLCGNDRQIKHSYAGDCDRVCDVCGTSRETDAAHLYDNAVDAICNRCELVREVTHTGWVNVSGRWAYYQRGAKLVNHWQRDSVGWCYVGADGYCVTDRWQRDSVGWCYLDGNGRMATNRWAKDRVGWCYVGGDGYCVANRWQRDSVGWCYLGADCSCVANRWQQDSVGWCYLGVSGRMVTNSYVRDSHGLCYLNAAGYWDGKYR